MADAPEPPGVGLRNSVFDLDPAEVGLVLAEGRTVWGVLFDRADPSWVMTVVSLVDGTTSLYTTGTFGVIGAGEHEDAADASRGLIKAAEFELKLFEPATDRGYPPPGSVRIWALTTDGPRMAEAPEHAANRRFSPPARPAGPGPSWGRRR
jgi:hypothetical protein